MATQQENQAKVDAYYQSILSPSSYQAYKANFAPQQAMIDQANADIAAGRDPNRSFYQADGVTPLHDNSFWSTTGGSSFGGASGGSSFGGSPGQAGQQYTDQQIQDAIQKQLASGGDWNSVMANAQSMGIDPSRINQYRGMQYSDQQIKDNIGRQIGGGGSWDSVLSNGASMGLSADRLNSLRGSGGGYTPDQIRAAVQKQIGGGGSMDSVYANGQTMGLSREQIDSAMGQQSAFGGQGGGWGGATGAYGGYGGGMAGGGGWSGGYSPTQGGGNPYLEGMAGGMIGQANRNFQTQTLPALRSGAMQAGGYGGSRQGVMEANATNDFNNSLNTNLANLYGTDWTNQQNRNLTDQSQQNQFYTSQRALDQNGVQLGANLYGAGQNGQWQPISNATQAYSPFSGYGTTTNGTRAGGGWQGVAGGALAGASLASQNKWW